MSGGKCLRLDRLLPVNQYCLWPLLQPVFVCAQGPEITFQMDTIKAVKTLCEKDLIIQKCTIVVHASVIVSDSNTMLFGWMDG